MRLLYNLFFHPLAHFPGPVLHRASILPFIYKLVRGHVTLDVLALSDKYGPVFRVAPNELVFLNAAAWKDIYSHKNGAVTTGAEFSKYDRFYRNKYTPATILSENRENHALLRRHLLHGFSDKSLREQEPIIGEYVGLLIKRLRERCMGGSEASRVADPDAMGNSAYPEPGVFDMRTWFSWTTFDIIGDLAFGEPFGSLESAEPDAWVTEIERGSYFP